MTHRIVDKASTATADEEGTTSSPLRKLSVVLTTAALMQAARSSSSLVAEEVWCGGADMGRFGPMANRQPGCAFVNCIAGKGMRTAQPATPQPQRPMPSLCSFNQHFIPILQLVLVVQGLRIFHMRQPALEGELRVPMADMHALTSTRIPRQTGACAIASTIAAPPHLSATTSNESVFAKC